MVSLSLAYCYPIVKAEPSFSRSYLGVMQRKATINSECLKGFFIGCCENTLFLVHHLYHTYKTICEERIIWHFESMFLPVDVKISTTQ